MNLKSFRGFLYGGDPDVSPKVGKEYFKKKKKDTTPVFLRREKETDCDLFVMFCLHGRFDGIFQDFLKAIFSGRKKMQLVLDAMLLQKF